MNPHEDVALIATSVPLDNGCAIAECVNTDGSVALWILAPGYDPGCACKRHAPHEQPGPLPAFWKTAVGLVCTWVNPRTGRRCRTTVGEFGGRCRQHPEGTGGPQ